MVSCLCTFFWLLQWQYSPPFPWGTDIYFFRFDSHFSLEVFSHFSFSVFFIQFQPHPTTSPRYWTQALCRFSWSSLVSLVKLRASGSLTEGSPMLNTWSQFSCHIIPMPTPSLTLVSPCASCFCVFACPCVRREGQVLKCCHLSL